MTTTPHEQEPLWSSPALARWRDDLIACYAQRWRLDPSEVEACLQDVMLRIAEGERGERPSTNFFQLEPNAQRAFLAGSLNRKLIDRSRRLKTRPDTEALDERVIAATPERDDLDAPLDARLSHQGIYMALRWDQSSRETTDYCALFLWRARILALQRALDLNKRDQHQFEASELIDATAQCYPIPAPRDLARTIRHAWPQLLDFWYQSSRSMVGTRLSSAHPVIMRGREGWEGFNQI